MTRRRRRLLIAIAVVVFLAISFELARWLSLENVERTKILALLASEAHGDRAAMLRQLHDCTAACRADVRYDAAHLRKPARRRSIVSPEDLALRPNSRSYTLTKLRTLISGGRNAEGTLRSARRRGEQSGSRATRRERDVPQ